MARGAVGGERLSPPAASTADVAAGDPPPPAARWGSHRTAPANRSAPRGGAHPWSPGAYRRNASAPESGGRPDRTRAGRSGPGPGPGPGPLGAERRPTGRAPDRRRRPPSRDAAPSAPRRPRRSWWGPPPRPHRASGRLRWARHRVGRAAESGSRWFRTPGAPARRADLRRRGLPAARGPSPCRPRGALASAAALSSAPPPGRSPHRGRTSAGAAGPGPAGRTPPLRPPRSERVPRPGGRRRPPRREPTPLAHPAGPPGRDRGEGGPRNRSGRPGRRTRRGPRTASCQAPTPRGAGTARPAIRGPGSQLPRPTPGDGSSARRGPHPVMVPH
ncbi:hypothetical protein G443_004399 [Actinoalloteichus cyanogriseus DSM 43889]|uniref:Basic proline-rich protein n=1 Tax=Actinoalloteichus caeruleus DSM 43889 TaxID=1120930 RepID=A0ABT1JPF2_ACTCY|nr:hypothetical protein [Actinoalloteichus caeruleus DSM 43889]